MTRVKAKASFSYTCNLLTFANTTAIAYYQNLEAPGHFCPYVIAVVFANGEKLREPSFQVPVKEANGFN